MSDAESLQLLEDILGEFGYNVISKPRDRRCFVSALALPRFP